MKKWIMIAGLLLLSLPVAALADDFTYTTNADNTITITGYTGPGGEVIIPDTTNGLPVTSIGGGMYSKKFEDHARLTGITIPKSVTNIGAAAFYCCTSLSVIAVDTLNSSFSSMDGVVFNKNQTSLIRYPAGKAGNYTIPTSVTRIESYAFRSCAKLTGVTISNSVNSIGSSAFDSCSLSSIAMPSRVTGVGIGTWAFRSCTNLTSVTIPNGVTSVWDGMFDSCTSLTSVTISDSVTSIGTWAFRSCTNLTSITVDEQNSRYSSLDGVLFDKRLTTLIQCPKGKGGSYKIPDSVTSIRDEAFNSCSELTKVYFNGNAPDVGSEAFTGADKTTVYYLQGTTGWGATFSGRPTAIWKP